MQRRNSVTIIILYRNIIIFLCMYKYKDIIGIDISHKAFAKMFTV